MSKDPMSESRRLDCELAVARAMRNGYNLQITQLERQVEYLKAQEEVLGRVQLMFFDFFSEKHREIAREFVEYAKQSGESQSVINEAITGIKDI